LDEGDLLALTAAMVVAGTLMLLIDTGASAFFIANVQRIPALPIWKGQLQNRAAIHGAFLSVAALMALAFEVLGGSAFVLFLLPLMAARRAFRRYASIHTTYVQTIRALSKVPEMAGYAPQGHSIRVAEVATSIARDRGLSDNEVQDIEFAALLHDVGRLSFDDPGAVPESAVGTRTGRQLALTSARIVGKTPYLARVAQIVNYQDEPFAAAQRTTAEFIPRETQIVKVSNDFVELTEEGGPRLSRLMAMHQLEQMSGTDYDPEILTALRHVLKRRPSL
jgi:response regulator RpfG family c-di-GMP phosphodiesterase